ncbi:unnamed protein product [Meganyctiphanes norvegica]|uniref:RING-type domain-containing protein n=1 Tax=Meganyctiphanes norvegica TaxID=48144 RepID=A0AAV2QYE0_MEGNR
MDFLECKICHVPYDEEGHRPRNAHCGHEICTACAMALIKDSIFECPKCRMKHKVDIADDLPVCFGLVDVIRAFRTTNITMTNTTGSKVSGATNEEVCNVHSKAISHWCIKCQMWICKDCLESHTYLIGCSTAISTKAMEGMKAKTIKDIDTLLNRFEEDTSNVASMIQEQRDRRKELLEKVERHSEEIQKLCNLLEQGSIQKENLIKSKDHLKSANSPQAVSDQIKVVTQRKQSLRSWSAKNLGKDTLLDLPKVLKEGKEVYTKMVIQGETRHSKLSQHEQYIYLHFFRKQALPDRIQFIPFDNLQKMIFEAPLIFLEMSLGGVVKEYIQLRLNRNMPNIRDNFVHIVTGQRGPSLKGLHFKGRRLYKDIYVANLPFKNITVTPDNFGIPVPKEGDILGYFQNNYLQNLFIFAGNPTEKRGFEECCCFGSIEDGLDVLKECYDNHSRGVIISDCGLVIEQK